MIISSSSYSPKCPCLFHLLVAWACLLLLRVQIDNFSFAILPRSTPGLTASTSPAQLRLRARTTRPARVLSEIQTHPIAHGRSCDHSAYGLGPVRCPTISLSPRTLFSRLRTIPFEPRSLLAQSVPALSTGQQRQLKQFGLAESTSRPWRNRCACTKSQAARESTCRCCKSRKTISHDHCSQ